MNPDVKTAWVTALRSGEYKQTNGYLRVDKTAEELNALRKAAGDPEDYPADSHLPPVGYCCLGVLCDIYAKLTGKAIWVSSEDDERAVLKPTDSEAGWDAAVALPPTVQEWAGLATSVKTLSVKTLNGEIPSGGDPEVSVVVDCGNEKVPTKKSLASLNDSGYTFEQIANLIEEQL